MKCSTVTIYDPTAPDDETLDVIGGIADRDVRGFVDRVGSELSAILGVRSDVGRGLIRYHVDGPVVRCKPVGLGPSPVAEVELRALAREVAMAIVGSLRDRVASEHAA